MNHGPTIGLLIMLEGQFIQLGPECQIATMTSKNFPLISSLNYFVNQENNFSTHRLFNTDFLKNDKKPRQQEYKPVNTKISNTLAKNSVTRNPVRLRRFQLTQNQNLISKNYLFQFNQNKKINISTSKQYISLSIIKKKFVIDKNK